MKVAYKASTTQVGTTSAIVVTGLLAVAGRWAQDKPLDVKVVVGIAVASLFLAFMAEVNEPLAQGFGILIVTVAAFTYLPDIAKKLGLAK